MAKDRVQESIDLMRHLRYHQLAGYIYHNTPTARRTREKLKSALSIGGVRGFRKDPATTQRRQMLRACVLLRNLGNLNNSRKMQQEIKQNKHLLTDRNALLNWIHRLYEIYFPSWNGTCIVSAHGAFNPDPRARAVELPPGVEVITFTTGNRFLSLWNGWRLFLYLMAGDYRQCERYFRCRSYRRSIPDYVAFGTRDFPSGIFAVGRAPGAGVDVWNRFIEQNNIPGRDDPENTNLYWQHALIEPIANGQRLSLREMAYGYRGGHKCPRYAGTIYWGACTRFQ